MTLNDFERRNGRYFALFQRIRVAFGSNCVKTDEDIGPTLTFCDGNVAHTFL